MDQPFIYKYRPKHLKEFIIDHNIVELLNNFIQIDSLNTLFVGDSGSGKSTLINCLIQEYYNDNINLSDILIINSLKEQGIAYYRSEVKTFCQTMCSKQNKKKLLIIDDIDNINEQSQQVFRNCIDKYSNNINLIATCSNIQKVIDSFQSRVIIIQIKLLELNNLEGIITQICTKENIIINKNAIDFVLSICNNSVRTIINYLEKFKLLGMDITYNVAVNTCTNISYKDFDKYTILCKDSKNLNQAILIIYSIYDRGYSVIDILDNYFIFIKISDLVQEEKKYLIIKLLCKYITIFYNIHEDEIELAFFTNNLIEILSND